MDRLSLSFVVKLYSCFNRPKINEKRPMMAQFYEKLNTYGSNYINNTHSIEFIFGLSLQQSG